MDNNQDIQYKQRKKSLKQSNLGNMFCVCLFIRDNLCRLTVLCWLYTKLHLTHFTFAAVYDQHVGR